MNPEFLNRHFQRMGARVKLSLPRADRMELRPLAVDVRRDAQGEYFEVRRDPALVKLDVVDVRPAERHLLLLARFETDGRKDKFVCGHDERAWFAAAVPNLAGISNVRTALEALRPRIVRDLAASTPMRADDMFRRRTGAYLRQGEWFFVPAPRIQPPANTVLRNEPLRRGNGKPHWAEFLFRAGGERVYVRTGTGEVLTEAQHRRLLRRQPEAAHWGWRPMIRNPGVFVRGRIRHADHATIELTGWHRVQMNRESEAPAMQHLTFLD